MIKRHTDGDGEAGAGEQHEHHSHEPGENTDSAADKELASLRLQLEDKDKEIGELKDKYLRTLAEADNTRKRIRQQGEDSVRLQREGLLRDLLPIVDNLERAVGAAQGGGNGKSIVEGVEMVLGSLLDFLRIQGVTRVDTVGQPFDPRLHEAVDHRASAEHQPNTVVEEFHRGYVTGDRVLRPARVAVSKAHGPGSTGGTNDDQS